MACPIERTCARALGRSRLPFSAGSGVCLPYGKSVHPHYTICVYSLLEAKAPTDTQVNIRDLCFSNGKVANSTNRNLEIQKFKNIKIKKSKKRKLGNYEIRKVAHSKVRKVAKSKSRKVEALRLYGPTCRLSRIHVHPESPIPQELCCSIFAHVPIFDFYNFAIFDFPVFEYPKFDFSISVLFF